MPRRKTSKRRGTPLTPWHVLFLLMCVDEGPPSFRIDSEVELLRRLARLDAVFERKHERALDRRAKILRRLWGWIEHVAVVEFKSDERPLRRGDLLYWLGRAQVYWSFRRSKGSTERVQAVLAVVRRTRTLREEVKHAGLTLVDEGGGYLALQGAPCEAKVVILSEVAKAERQPLLGIFSRDTLHIQRVEKWLGEHRDAYVEKMGNKLHHTHPELVEAFLRGIPAKQRVKGLAPEQRLEGLGKEEVVLALPDEILAALSPELLASLRPSVRRRVAARLQNGHGRKVRKRPAASKADRSRSAKPSRRRKTRSK